MSRTAQSNAIQKALLDTLTAEGAAVEDMTQVAARASDPVARGLFQHLGRAHRNVFFIKGVGLINVHVRSELRGWWNILESVKKDFDWLHNEHGVKRYFVLLIGRKDKYIADGYVFSDFNGPIFLEPPRIIASKFTINEKQHLESAERISSINKVGKVLLATAGS